MLESNVGFSSWKETTLLWRYHFIFCPMRGKRIGEARRPVPNAMEFDKFGYGDVEDDGGGG